MADQKITDLTELTTISKDDLFVVVDDPAGTPVSKKITKANALAGAANCWVASTQSSTTIESSYNVASVADTGTGISTVTIATDFAAATYCVIVGAEHNSASGTTQTYNIDNGGRAAGTYVIQSWQVDGTEALTDPSASWFSAAFGAQ